MIYLKLFWEFLKIGLFTFGGAYGAIPLIQNSVLKNGWMDVSMFSNLLALSESTPGPIMVNAATFIGYHEAGVAGSLTATFAVVLPSFVIIVCISHFLKKWLENKKIQSILNGIKPCLTGVILATGLWMLLNTAFPEKTADYTAVLICAVLVLTAVAVRKIWNKELSPIALILISAVLGIILY